MPRFAMGLKNYIGELNDISEQELTRRNAIIGGDFSTNPWQRGTSFVTPVNTDFSADRWKIFYVTSATVTISKSADAPTIAQAGRLITHCLLIDCTAADAAVAAGDYFLLSQPIEGYRWLAFAQRALTLRFWHRHTKTGTYCVGLRNSGFDRCYVAEYTQAVTDVWEEAIIPIAASPSAGTWDYTTGIGGYLTFTLLEGSSFFTKPNSWNVGNLSCTANQVNGLDSTANNFRIADVRIAAGDMEGAIEVRSLADELALCLRYLPAVRSLGTADSIGSGMNFSTTASKLHIPFHVPARVAPTGITISNVAHLSVLDAAAAAVACNGCTYNRAGIDGAEISTTVAAGLVAGNGTNVFFNNASGLLLFTGCEL